MGTQQEKDAKQNLLQLQELCVISDCKSLPFFEIKMAIVYEVMTVC
jgi:hypothetical protein